MPVFFLPPFATFSVLGTVPGKLAAAGVTPIFDSSALERIAFCYALVVRFPAAPATELAFTDPVSIWRSTSAIVALEREKHVNHSKLKTVNRLSLVTRLFF